jgi:hypothetical protein
MPWVRGIKPEPGVMSVLLPQMNSTQRTNESSCALVAANEIEDSRMKSGRCYTQPNSKNQPSALTQPHESESGEHEEVERRLGNSQRTKNWLISRAPRHRAQRGWKAWHRRRRPWTKTETEKQIWERENENLRSSGSNRIERRYLGRINARTATCHGANWNWGRWLKPGGKTKSWAGTKIQAENSTSKTRSRLSYKWKWALVWELRPSPCPDTGSHTHKTKSGFNEEHVSRETGIGQLSAIGNWRWTGKVTPSRACSTLNKITSSDLPKSKRKQQKSQIENMNITSKMENNFSIGTWTKFTSETQRSPPSLPQLIIGNTNES